MYIYFVILLDILKDKTVIGTRTDIENRGIYYIKYFFVNYNVLDLSKPKSTRSQSQMCSGIYMYMYITHNNSIIIRCKAQDDCNYGC